MANQKQFGERLAQKQVKDGQVVEKKAELKGKKIRDMKVKLGQAKERSEKRKRHMTKQEALSVKSKAIRKVDPLKAAEVKAKKLAAIKPKVDDYAAFMNAENHAYNQLRKRTIQKLKLDKELIKKAAKSLINFHAGAKKPNDLLDDNEDFIYLEIILSMVPEQYSIRPLQIPLPTPLYGSEQNSKFCVFAKDPQRQYKDMIKDLDIPSIARVIGYSKIEKKFPTYKDKLKLFYSYDQFFVDYTIYDLIRKPTGKIFYERKKIPFPINCSEVPADLKEKFGEDYEAYLNDLANYSYFSMGNGPVYTVKIARTNMNIKDIVKNVIHGVYNTVPHLLKQKIKHNRVRQLNLKTFNSISLPIFTQLTGEEQQAFTTADATTTEAK